MSWANKYTQHELTDLHIFPLIGNQLPWLMFAFALDGYMHCAYTVVSKDFMLTLQLYDIIIPSQGAAHNVLCTACTKSSANYNEHEQWMYTRIVYIAVQHKLSIHTLNTKSSNLKYSGAFISPDLVSPFILYDIWKYFQYVLRRNNGKL